MAARRKRHWEYLKFLDAAKAAAEAAIGAFNQTRNPYRDESTLLLLSNAWELLAKAVLLKHHKRIDLSGGGTISAEKAVYRLAELHALDRRQIETIQQIVSLRNEAAHNILPPLPEEVVHHLMYYAVKFFRVVVAEQFPGHEKDMVDNALSLSFGEMTTYADKVQKAISQVKRSKDDSKLVWLLERGIAFDGSSYLTQKQVADKYKNKHRIRPNLELSGFLDDTDMVRIVPVEAPKNYTADLTLRRGKATNTSLPVVTKRTDVEADYPYLTTNVGERIGRSTSWVAKAVRVLNLMGDDRYHQEIRTSKSGSVHRYSEAAVQALKQHLSKEPDFNPFHL